MLSPANVENPGVVEKQFSPFPGESFAMRIDAGEIVARRSAYQEVERTPTGQILYRRVRVRLEDFGGERIREKSMRIGGTVVESHYIRKNANRRSPR